jgi:hypothetical protein
MLVAGSKMAKGDRRRVSLFEKLDSKELELLETNVRERTVGPDTVIFSQDDDGDASTSSSAGR